MSAGAGRVARAPVFLGKPSLPGGRCAHPTSAWEDGVGGGGPWGRGGWESPRLSGPDCSESHHLGTPTIPAPQMTQGPGVKRTWSSPNLGPPSEHP